MHPSDLTGNLLDYYETNVRPSIDNEVQFKRTMFNLVSELQSSLAYLFTIRHYEQCKIAGEKIVENFKRRVNTEDKQVKEFETHLRQMDMAAKIVPAWVNI